MAPDIPRDASPADATDWSPQPPVLPMTMEEARDLGITQFDVILVTGDAYVDHPSFGTAVIGRVLGDAGYRVGVIAQPDWRSDADLRRLGTPRLFFGISAGNVDPMVNAFTPNLKRRSQDAYSPGGEPGRRPDRATAVYSDRIHTLFPRTPVVIGGIEASLRRFAHYDYWTDRVRHSILADAPADLLVYGMGERQVVAIAGRIAGGEAAARVRDIAGTCYAVSPAEWRDMDREGMVVLPSYDEAAKDPAAYAEAFRRHAGEQNPLQGHPVVQPHPKVVIIQNPPSLPLSPADLDRIYELPYTRAAHPSYTEKVPALETVRFSITSHRGCFGGCAFCALTHHQGRVIQSRSHGSILREAEGIARMKGFSGVITDVGGPTANMYGMECPRWSREGPCPDRSCGPGCPSLRISHSAYLRVLRELRRLPSVRHVFVGSGFRHDLILADPDDPLPELAAHHISGHMKIAPEHIADPVLAAMRKPPARDFDRFLSRFRMLQQGKRKKQYILPYFMSGHPGCTVAEMVTLAEYIRDERLYTEQVQDFTPTPMTLSTTMYVAGCDPFTGAPVHVPRGREKRIQRAMLQYRDPAHFALVREGLLEAGREDLIGDAPGCLIPRGLGRWSPEGRACRDPPV